MPENPTPSGLLQPDAANNGNAGAGAIDALSLFRRLSSATVATSFQPSQRDQFGGQIYNRSNTNLANLATQLGYSAIGSGNRSTAVGSFAYAREDSAVALGVYALALGPSSVAIGDQALSSGYRSITIGNQGQGNALGAISIGFQARALGVNAIAIGSQAYAIGANAISIGASARTVAAYSIAIGAGALVPISNSTGALAIGASANVTGAFGAAIALGAGATVLGTLSPAIAIGSNATVTAPGREGIAIGTNALVSARGAQAYGDATTASFIDSVAFGRATITTSANQMMVGNPTYPLSVNISGSTPWVDVIAYGATGNGTTDDTLFFKNALIQAYATGAVVFVPVGNYKITARLTLSTGMVMTGMGRLSKLSSAIPIGVSELIRLGGDYAAISNIWLHGTGQGDGTIVNGSRGIWIGNTTDYITVGNVNYARVENCIIDQFIGNGISGDYTYAVIVNNVIKNNTDANIFLQPSCSFNLIQGNTLTGSRYSGIDCNGANNRITNNICSNNGGGSLDPAAWAGILLANVSTTNQCVLNTVEGNHCADNVGAGIMVFGVVQPAYGNVIRGNVCTGHVNTTTGSVIYKPAGIILIGCNQTVVEANVCRANRDNYLVTGSGAGNFSYDVILANNKSINATSNGYNITQTSRLDGGGDEPPRFIVIKGNSDVGAAVDSFYFETSTRTLMHPLIQSNRSLNAGRYAYSTFGNNVPTLYQDYDFQSNYGFGYGTAFESGFTVSGIVTLSGAGTALIYSTRITTTGTILLAAMNTSGTAGAVYISTSTAIVSATIASTNAADTRSIHWLLVD